jgi:hypothetical protein
MLTVYKTAAVDVAMEGGISSTEEVKEDSELASELGASKVGRLKRGLASRSMTGWRKRRKKEGATEETDRRWQIGDGKAGNRDDGRARLGSSNRAN